MNSVGRYHWSQVSVCWNYRWPAILRSTAASRAKPYIWAIARLKLFWKPSCSIQPQPIWSSTQRPGGITFTGGCGGCSTPTGSHQFWSAKAPAIKWFCLWATAAAANTHFWSKPHWFWSSPEWVWGITRPASCFWWVWEPPGSWCFCSSTHSAHPKWVPSFRGSAACWGSWAAAAWGFWAGPTRP